MASIEDAPGLSKLTAGRRFTQLLSAGALYDSAVFYPPELGEILAQVQEGAISFDLHCPDCNKLTTWRVIPNSSIPGGQRARNQIGASVDSQVLRNVMGHLQFRCARVAQHEADFNLRFEYLPATAAHRVQQARLTKIGQWPSLATLAASEIDDYRAFVAPEDLVELKRATGLAAHGVGIGSFVYLRRIFERLVDAAADAAIAAGEPLTRAEFDRLRMEDKLQAVRNHVPAWMVENRKLYSVLSKGLHELSEDACKEAFPAVKQATLALLEQSAEDARRKQRATQAALDLATLQASLASGSGKGD